jgi:hypothetical protein
MTTDPRFGYDAMRRRARLYCRQIALAVLLTALAAGFLISAFANAPSGLGHSTQRSAAVAR